MLKPRIILGLSLVTFSLSACANRSKPANTPDSAEARAVEFLQREVPAWARDNGCYSCHNNGDAARALHAASHKGYEIPQQALADTSAWVASPAKWDHNKGDPGFSDKRLADVQFAASLAAAVESGAVKAAALKVAQAQAEDGSWPIDTANAVGSPATYGTTLATFMAWDSLRRASAPDTSVAQRKAEGRLAAIKPDSVLNAAVVLLCLANNGKGRAGSPLPAAHPNALDGAHGVTRPTSPLASSLDFLRRAQTRDGGWGPYTDSPPEAFDTALALLALTKFRTVAGAPEMISRGREFLTAMQLPDGSWPATTRPSGGESYAQQMSTTGWVVLALLATR